MTNHIDEAKEATKSLSNGGLTYDGRITVAKIHALIAIAEQLQLANLIALSESGRTTVNGARAALSALYTGSAEEGSAHMRLKPEIAELLGVKDD